MFTKTHPTFGALAILLALPALTAHAQDRPQAPRRLTVTGQGKAEAKPDLAHITIGVMTENKSSQEAAKANAEASQRFQNAIKKFGIAAKDIQTVNYSIEPQRGDITPDGKLIITGYRVYNQVRVTVRDLPKMGDILDAATEADSNAISGIQFGFQDSSSIADRALEQALRDAKRKADRMAMTLGARIIGVYEAKEGQTIPPPATQTGLMGGFGGSASPLTLIQPGEMTFYANVTIVYEMEKNQRNALSSPPRRTTRVRSTDFHPRAAASSVSPRAAWK